MNLINSKKRCKQIGAKRCGEIRLINVDIKLFKGHFFKYRKTSLLVPGVHTFSNANFYLLNLPLI